MKKIVLLSAFLFAINFQAQVKFETSLTEAFKIAKEQNKTVFIEYYNSECTVCKKLNNLMETDSVVSNFYNKYFINYKMDTKGDADGKLKPDENALLQASKLTFDQVPVLLFFDFDENFLHHSGVNVTSNDVVNIGRKALQPNYRSTSNAKKYQEGDRSVRTLYAYCDYLVVTQNDSLLKTVSDDLYVSFSNDIDRLNSISSYTILKNVINTTSNGFFIYWMHHLESLKDFEKGYLKGQEKLALEKILLKQLTDPNIKNWSEEKKNLHKDYLLKLEITDKPELYFE